MDAPQRTGLDVDRPELVLEVHDEPVAVHLTVDGPPALIDLTSVEGHTTTMDLRSVDGDTALIGLKKSGLPAEDARMSSQMTEKPPVVGRARVSLTTDEQVARRDALMKQLDEEIAADKAPKRWFQRR